MPNSTPPPYPNIALCYPYGQIFLLLHDGLTVDEDTITAYGDLLQQPRSIWFAVLTFHVRSKVDGPPAPVLAPPKTEWDTGFALAAQYYQRVMAGEAIDPHAFLSGTGVSFPMFQAGLMYHLYPDRRDDDDAANLILDLLNLIAHL